MAVPTPVPAAALTPGDFIGDCEPADLVSTPAQRRGRRHAAPPAAGGTGRTRRAIVVDVATTRSFRRSSRTRGRRTCWPTARTISFASSSRRTRTRTTSAAWPSSCIGSARLVPSSGSPATTTRATPTWRRCEALEDHAGSRSLQPTSGITRSSGRRPGVRPLARDRVANHFDSYGVSSTNASITLKVEFPAARVEQRDHDRRYLRIRQPQALLLGAQCTDARVGARDDRLRRAAPSDSPAAKALRMALGSDPLRAQVFKVPHHASKHGVNLELVELIKPRLTLISRPPEARGTTSRTPSPRSRSRHRGARGDRLDRRAPPARPRARHPLHQRERLRRPATRLARSRRLPPPAGSAASGAPATGHGADRPRRGQALRDQRPTRPCSSSSRRPFRPNDGVAAAAGHGHAGRAAPMDRAGLDVPEERLT